jgi:hypothetical protein
MLDPRPPRLHSPSPVIAAPPAFVDRRVASRRAVDRHAHEERALLARALDILAAGSEAEARLAGILDLLAETVGARRAAVLSDDPERRLAVAIADGEDTSAAKDLAAWLDASSARSMAERAASGRGHVSIVVADTPFVRSVASGVPGTIPSAGGAPWYALLAMPSAGDVVLGFEFDAPQPPDHLATRLPPQLARHAAVALALVSAQLVAERELTVLQAVEAERARFV